jgi:hypothetical protein
VEEKLKILNLVERNRVRTGGDGEVEMARSELQSEQRILEKLRLEMEVERTRVLVPREPVVVHEEPAIPEVPVAPNVRRNLAVGLLGGARGGAAGRAGGDVRGGRGAPRPGAGRASRGARQETDDRKRQGGAVRVVDRGLPGGGGPDSLMVAGVAARPARVGDRGVRVATPRVAGIAPRPRTRAPVRRALSFPRQRSHARASGLRVGGRRWRRT